MTFTEARTRARATMTHGLLTGIAMTAMLMPSSLLAQSSPPQVSGPEQQTRFDKMLVFGDSYSTGHQNSPANLGNPALYPSPGADPAALSQLAFITYPYFIQRDLGIANDRYQNYAIGGSTSDVLNAVGLPISLPFQLSQWNGRKIEARELVTLSVGGNDALRVNGTIFNLYRLGPDGTQFNDAAAIALGAQAAARVGNAIGTLVAAGAHDISLGSFSDLSLIPIIAATPNPAASKTYGATLFQKEQEEVRKYAVQGTRIFLFDTSRLMQQVRANPAAFGFQSYAAAPGLRSFFQPDGMHLSSAGMELGAAYVANVIVAPDTVAVQAESIAQVGSNVNRTLILRLSGAGALSADRPAAGGDEPARPLHFFGAALYASGKQDTRFGAYGFSQKQRGAILGLEYSGWAVRLGFAGAYSSTSTDVAASMGGLDGDHYSIAAFAALDGETGFVRAAASYTRSDADLDRPGIISPLAARLRANSLAADVRAAKLFGTGGVQFGPVGNLGYVRTKVRDYSEVGDPSLIYDVSQKPLSRLTGGAGIEVRIAPGSKISGFVDVTAEHVFDGETRRVVSTLDQAPLLPIYSDQTHVGDRTYGRIAAGVDGQASSTLTLGLHASSSFASDAHRDFQIAARARLAF